MISAIKCMQLQNLKVSVDNTMSSKSEGQQKTLRKEHWSWDLSDKKEGARHFCKALGENSPQATEKQAQRS